MGYALVQDCRACARREPGESFAGSLVRVRLDGGQRSIQVPRAAHLPHFTVLEGPEDEFLDVLIAALRHANLAERTSSKRLFSPFSLRTSRK